MIFDALSATHLYTERVSSDGIFLSQADGLTGGVKLINRRGVVMRVFVDEDTIVDHIASKHPAIAKSLSDRYCYRQSRDEVKMQFDKFFNGRDYKTAGLICALSKGDGYETTSNPYSSTSWLRNENTLNMFKSAGGDVGDSFGGSEIRSGGSAMLLYFQSLLTLPGALNSYESLELCRAACNHRRVSLLREWIYSSRLELSEEIGDLVSSVDKELGTVIYTKVKCLHKVLGSLIQQNQMQRIYLFVKKAGSGFDFMNVLRQILSNPATCQRKPGSPDYMESMVKYAILESNPRLVDPTQLFTVFMQNNQLNYITSVFCDLIKELEASLGSPEIDRLETRILEANITTDVSTAEVIFQQGCMTKFDKQLIAKVCERYGMYKRALECYENFDDISRIMRKASSSNELTQDWLFAYLDKHLTPDQVLTVLNDMLADQQENLVIQYARMNYQKLGVEKLLDMFESRNSVEGVFYFTGSVLNAIDSPDVHFKYIQTAALTQNWQECERVIKESKSYDPAKVKDFLKGLVTQGDGDVASQVGGLSPKESAVKCLIHLCDIHNYVDELTEFLYREHALEYLELYVTRVNPDKTSTVINLLMNLGIADDKILEILNAVRGSCNIETVVRVMESRGRLPIILLWMEDRLKDMGFDLNKPSPSAMSVKNPSASCLLNSIAKVYVDRRDPSLRAFLENNKDYDCKTIGAYCENKDPHMAVLAYSRGHCDKELIHVTNRNGLYRLQAKYLLERENDPLWDYVLQEQDGGMDGSPSSEHRNGMIDQLLATGLLEAKSSSQILCAVKALARAELRKSLQDLLERVILHKTIASNLVDELTNSSSLQNLLLLTAMQNDKKRAQELIGQLDKIDASQAAEAALLQGGMEEEALAIYEKHGMHLKALEVMLEKKDDLDSAEAYAVSVKTPLVWSKIGSHCLRKARNLLDTDRAAAGSIIAKCMKAYSQVDKCPETAEIIDVARKAERLDELVCFLKHLRSSGSHSTGVSVDTDLAYALARTNKLNELEALLGGVHTVNCQKLGDLLFVEAEKQEGGVSSDLYKLANLFYHKVPNYAKVTSCFVRLGQHQDAVRSATKAGNPASWLEVAVASMDAGNWSVAETSALHVVEHGGDHLEKVVQGYESNGRYDDLVKILETGCKSTSNIQLLTELGAAYARYQPEKLLEYLKRTAGGNNSLLLNIPKLIKICEKERQWNCVIVLYRSCQEYDQALLTILNHPESCWDHNQICEILRDVTNPDLIYQTVAQYIDEHAEKLNDLLLHISTLSIPINYSKLIQTFKSHQSHLEANSNMARSPISLIVPYLELEQKKLAGKGVGAAIVNELLNEYYLNCEDVEKLKYSITAFPNFDQSELARRLEQSELLAMKQLALLLYRKDRKFEHAINIAKRFQQYPEAIAIAHQSQSSEVAENLLRFLVDYPPYFEACLRTCGELIRPEVAIELAWSHNMASEVMPYVIFTIKSINQRLANLEAKVDQQQQQRQQSKTSLMNTPALPPPMSTSAFGTSFIPL